MKVCDRVSSSISAKSTVPLLRQLWQGQLHSEDRASRGKSAADNRYLRIFFYNKCIIRKCLTLKMKVKIREYTNRNGPIRLKISTSVKVISEHHFSLALTVLKKFPDLENVIQSRCTTFAVASCLTFYLMAIVILNFPSRHLSK